MRLGSLHNNSHLQLFLIASAYGLQQELWEFAPYIQVEVHNCSLFSNVK